MVRRSLALALAAHTTAAAHASLTMLAGPSGASHTNNLVTNGSFENGAPTPDGSLLFWANPSYAPYAVPPGWSSSGTNQTYARWGNDGPGPARLAGSDLLPDGRNGLYFGNLTTTVDRTPVFQPSGAIGFVGGSPTFSPVYGGPCVLSQTIPTNTNAAPSYLLSFWTSGENAVQAAWPNGVFGLRVTNVLPGDPMQYLAAPGGAGALGASHRYDFAFVPLNPSLPVTIEFYNWGHLTSWPVGGNPVSTFTTELVLDDVIVNPVPTPGTLAAIALLGLGRRRTRIG
jgi:hypothetical protein